MSATARLLRPASQFTPRSISGLALWLDGSDTSSLYTTDAGPVTAVSSPLDISGCALWLDASNAGSISATSGSVDQWSDLSGAGRNFTASSTARPTTGTRTLNGRNVIDFDGTNNQLTGNSASLSMFQNVPQAAVFLVMKFDVTSANQYFFEHKQNGGAGARFQIFTQPGSNIVLGGRRLDADSLVTVSLSAGATTTPCIIAGVADYANSDLFLRRDGATLASTTSFQTDGNTSNTASSGQTLGGVSGLLLDGYIAEVVVYNTALTTAQRAQVESYLAAKWGISGVHTTATTAGDPVGYWSDKSVNGRNATQSTAASRPTVTTVNGRKALAFDGSNGWMKTDRTAYAARSVFAVFRRTATVSQATYKGPFAKQAGTTDAAYGGTASASAQTGGWIAASSGGNNRLYWNNAALTASYHNGASISAADSANYLVGFPAPIDTTTPAIVYAEVAGEASGNQCWFVGTEPYSTARKYPADFCEALIYSRALTSTERRRVEQYLANRWGITLAPQVSDPDAQTWVNSVYAAGSTVSTPAASAVNDFVIGCKADGIWTAMKSVVVLAGADTLAGALAPLKGTAPTSYNFASGDYSKTSGLKGNGSSTYLDSNRNNTAEAQDNRSVAVYVTDKAADGGTVRGLIYAGDNGTAGSTGIGWRQSDGTLLFQSSNTSAYVPTSASVLGLLGVSRSNASQVVVRYNGASTTQSISSSTTYSGNYFPYRRNAANYTSARMSFYSIGDSLDLALLDARVSALMTTLGSL